jgi:hypothetical protein
MTCDSATVSVCHRSKKANLCRVRCRCEGCSYLTVEEVMAEPMVRELMRADRVDPAAFEALLRSVAARSPGRSAQPGRRRGGPRRSGVKSTTKA